MGIKTAGVFLSHEWASLSATARLVVATLAVSTLDDASDRYSANRYWGGHDSLILRVWGIESHDDDYSAAKRKLSRAIAELIAAGAITRIESARRGRQAVYELNPRRPVDNTNTAAAPGGHHSPPDR